MLVAAIPLKFNIPFGNAAAPADINVVPQASQIGITPGAASLTDGFPPVCFLPVDSGGTPAWGRDVNGVLFQISGWDRWQAAGGPIAYDSAFSAAIGGYPLGARLIAAAGNGKIWVSTVDGNTTNPDAAGAGWISGSLGRLIGVGVWSTPGTATYTPTAGTASVVFEVQGAGGGGAGAIAAGSGNAAGGFPGNAGAYGRGRYTSAFAGITITVGAKGVGGSGTSGTNGGASSAGALLSAPGGPGGTAGLASAGNASGGNGNTSGTPSGANMGGAVGGIGQISFGFTTGQVAQGGGGGQSQFGSGGVGVPANNNGQNSLSAGAGGSGTMGTNNTDPLLGGNGGDGLVIVWEYSA